MVLGCIILRSLVVGCLHRILALLVYFCTQHLVRYEVHRTQIILVHSILRTSMITFGDYERSADQF